MEAIKDAEVKTQVDFHYHIIDGVKSGLAIDLGDGSHYHKFGLSLRGKTEPTSNGYRNHFHTIIGRLKSVSVVGTAVWNSSTPNVGLRTIKSERVILGHVFKQPKIYIDKYGKRRVLREIGGGAAGTWLFVNTSRTNLLNGTFDIDTDSYKVALFLSTSDIAATETTYAGVTNEHANANGYTTGGIAVTLTLAGTTTVTVDIATDPVWTASGGSIVARFAILYEVSGSVLCYALLDSAPADVTATDGNTLTVAANASGVFTLA